MEKLILSTALAVLLATGPVSATEPAADTAAMHLPKNPDPDPPSNPGSHIGETRRHTPRIGDWEHTIDYVYEVRYGKLGWHLDAMVQTYKPKPD